MEGKDVIVPDSTEVLLHPEKQGFSELFHEVKIQSLEDLNNLGIVPTRLDEGKLRLALEEDDERCLQLAQKLYENQASPCNCNENSHKNMMYNYRRSFRAIYDRIRRNQNLSLSKLLSIRSGTKVEWDTLVPLHIRHYMIGLNDKAKMATPVNIAKVKNIDVGSKGGLTLGDSQKMLVANDIIIHKGGKIKINTPYIYIKCHSIQGEVP